MNVITKSPLQQARSALFLQGDAHLAMALILPKLKELALEQSTPEDERTALYQLAAMACVETNDLAEAIHYFALAKDHYQAGYYQLIQGNLGGVLDHWEILAHQHPSHWCFTLLGMITHQLKTYPTMLQVRCHLEADIYNLLRFQQMAYVDSVVAYTEFLTNINFETPKFIGRAFLSHGLFTQAEHFLLQGQRSLPQDPEVYYHLGQLKAQMGENANAILMLKQCLMISPTYQPADVLLSQLDTLDASN